MLVERSNPENIVSFDRLASYESPSGDTLVEQKWYLNNFEVELVDPIIRRLNENPQQHLSATDRRLLLQEHAEDILHHHLRTVKGLAGFPEKFDFDMIPSRTGRKLQEGSGDTQQALFIKINDVDIQGENCQIRNATYAEDGSFVSVTNTPCRLEDPANNPDTPSDTAGTMAPSVFFKNLESGTEADHIVWPTDVDFAFAVPEFVGSYVINRHELQENWASHAQKTDDVTTTTVRRKLGSLLHSGTVLGVPYTVHEGLHDEIEGYKTKDLRGPLAHKMPKSVRKQLEGREHLDKALKVFSESIEAVRTAHAEAREAIDNHNRIKAAAFQHDPIHLGGKNLAAVMRKSRSESTGLQRLSRFRPRLAPKRYRKTNSTHSFSL